MIIKRQGNHSIPVSHILMNLGDICNQSGKYNKAIKRYKKCHDIQINQLPPMSPEVNTTLDKIENATYNKNRQ